MGFLDRGRHSINKKYERFSEVQKLSIKYRRRTRVHRPRNSGDEEKEFALPSRRDNYEKKRVTISRLLRSIPLAVKMVVAYSKFHERMRRIKESRASAVLGYIPIKLFWGISLATFGLYPYTWMWGNAYAFNKVGGRRINEASIKGLAIMGFLVQLLLPASAAFYSFHRFTGSSDARGLSIQTACAFAVLYALLILPMRCFNYFSLRWALRSAVIEWDKEGVMVGRAMTSWFKLFLLGSAYIQHHINRLMGLGMPGFADVSEIEMDISLADIIDNYVTSVRPDRNVASWTKDDWEPEYDEDEIDG